MLTLGNICLLNNCYNKAENYAKEYFKINNICNLQIFVKKRLCKLIWKALVKRILVFTILAGTYHFTNVTVYFL